MKRGTAIALAMLAIRCAEPQPPRAPEPEGEWSNTPSRDVGTASLYDDSGRPNAPASLTFEDPPPDRFATTTIPSAPPRAAPRPRRVGKKNISFVGARLDNVLRMLAREGRFNLVLQSNLADPISVELHSVEPFDAALAIASANHLSLRYRNGIVVVGRSGKK